MLRAVGRVLVLVAVILSGGLLTGMMWLPVEKTPERTRLFLYEKPPRTSRFAWPVWSSVQDDLQSFNNTHKQTQEVRESDVTIEKLGKVFETRCNSLYASFKGQLISTEEGYLPDKFSGYELALVQVLTRHGDRAPLKGIPLADLSSFQCPDDKHYFADADTAMKTSNKCSRGRLTWNGCRQHETLGQHLKSIYHLDTKSIRSRTMVVSTDYQRTIQSAKCLIGGLLGHQNYRPIWKLPGTMFQMEKTGYLPNCPSIDVLWQETQKRTEFLHAKQKWYNIKTKLKQFFSQINRRLRSNQGPIEFYEGLICNYCQLNSSERSRMVTPCIKGHCLPPSLGEEIIKTADIYTKLHNQEKSAILQIQPFISQVVTKFRKWIEGARRDRVVVYSGHDTTLAALLTALHAFDGHRPPYASRIVFELWKRPQVKNDFIVRTLYNGQVINSDIISECMNFQQFEKNLLTGTLRSKESHAKGCLYGSIELQ